MTHRNGHCNGNGTPQDPRIAAAFADMKQSNPALLRQLQDDPAAKARLVQEMSDAVAEAKDEEAPVPPPPQPKATPFPNGVNGRAPGGKFAKGNPGGPGNPTFRKLAAGRRVILEAISDDELKELTRALWTRAVKGDNEAAKVLLGYRVGKAKEVVEPDRADLDELNLLMEDPSKAEVVLAGNFDIPAAQAAEAIRDRRAKLVPEDPAKIISAAVEEGAHTVQAAEACELKKARRMGSK
jgi:hypothetical protein